MPKRLQACALLFTSLLSCVFTHITFAQNKSEPRTILQVETQNSPEKNVGEVHSDHEILPLKPGQGYLMLAIEALEHSPAKIFLKGPKLFSSVSVSHLLENTQYRLLALPVGKYQYKHVLNPEYFGDQSYWDIEDQGFATEVKANSISYGGHLISLIENQEHAAFYYRNRSSQALRFLSQCCASLVKQYDFHYSGAFRDPFIRYSHFEQP